MMTMLHEYFFYCFPDNVWSNGEVELLADLFKREVWTFFFVTIAFL